MNHQILNNQSSYLDLIMQVYLTQIQSDESSNVHNQAIIQIGFFVADFLEVDAVIKYYFVSTLMGDIDIKLITAEAYAAMVVACN